MSEVESRERVNKALVFEWWSDGGGLYDLVDHGRKSTLLDMSLKKGLIVSLMVEVEPRNLVQRVFCDHQSLLVDVADISICSGR